jgi:hypothetical protein
MRLHPGYEQRPIDPKFMDSVVTPLTEAEATYYLKTAWKKIYGIYPGTNSLALLWAQSAGETGRWRLLRCNNWGNIKKRADWRWTSYDAGEVLNGKHQMFYPYHPQTHFAAWESPLDGAEAYIRFLSQRKRYAKAWLEVVIGDPVAYCVELKKAGYFTADLAHYTRGVVSLTNEFKRKADVLLAFEPPKPPPALEPEPEPIPEPAPEPEPIPGPQPDSGPEPAPDPEPKPSKGFFDKLLEVLSKIFLFWTK